MKRGDLTGEEVRSLRIWLNLKGRYGLPASATWGPDLERALADHEARTGAPIGGAFLLLTNGGSP